MNNQGLRSSGRGTKMFAMHPAIGRRPQAIAEEFGLVPRADRRDPKFAIRDPVMTALDRLRCGYSRHDPSPQSAIARLVPSHQLPTQPDHGVNMHHITGG